MRLVILFLTLTSNIVAEEIIGFPKIVDGDTVHINKYKIRLEGIDAPEIRQKCKKEKLKISSIIGFTFYKDYNCGEVSRQKLKKKVDRSKIKCISSSKDIILSLFLRHLFSIYFLSPIYKPSQLPKL